MPTNEELLKMEAVGVRIACAIEGWQMTLVRRDVDGTLYEETWPLRSSFDLARRDQRRYAPFLHLCQWQVAVCGRKMSDLACGVQKTRRVA